MSITFEKPNNRNDFQGGPGVWYFVAKLNMLKVNLQEVTEPHTAPLKKQLKYAQVIHIWFLFKC